MSGSGKAALALERLDMQRGWLGEHEQRISALEDAVSRGSGHLPDEVGEGGHYVAKTLHDAVVAKLDAKARGARDEAEALRKERDELRGLLHTPAREMHDEIRQLRSRCERLRGELGDAPRTASHQANDTLREQRDYWRGRYEGLVVKLGGRGA